MSKTRQISMRVTMAGLLALVLLASLFLATGAQAAPAMPEPLPFVQADGTTVMVQARGDEFFNWQECEQGYIIQHNHDTGRWYYAISITSDGTAIAGNEPVGDVSQNDAVGIEGFSFNQGSRMTSQDSLFQAVGNRVAEETYELIAVGTEYFLPIANDSAYALAAGMDAFSAATAPVHANPFPNSIVTRKYQPLLLMLLEWENVRFNDAEYAADFPYVGTSQASRLHDFWSSRTFGSTEFLNGPDIAGHNASLIDSHLEGITLNEWMIEASGNQNLFVRPDNMGADGRWGGRGSVDYFLPEVNEAIRTQGYFRAERDLLISLGVNNMHYLHIEHGIVSVRFAMGHINYNIVNQGGQNHQIIFATYGFNAVRHFINWDNVPKHWNPVVNQYDVFAQDLNFYIIYGGYEGALGGNAARPSFWAHASGLTRVNNIVRGPVYNAETGEQLCRGIGPTLGRATNPIRLVSVRYNPATGVRARHVYGSHGEQQATGVAQGLGVFIHELGHSVWDLPDKAVGGGLTSEELCIGFWCGMGRGTWGAFRYNNYNERLGSAGTHFRVTFAYQMGWLTPMTLDANDSWAGYVGHWSDPRTVRHWDPAIHSIANGDLPMAVKITSTNAVRELFPNAPEARNHEQFFMVENFQHVGFDRSASHEVWNRGIMVWHLDSRMAPQQHNNSHRRFNLEKVMIPNQGVRGNQIHSGWFSDPFWHPGEVFGPCPIPGHALRGWCYADCSVQFCDEGIHHIPISNFHAPQGQPVPDGFPGGGHLGSGNFHGFTATTGNNLNNPNWHAGATHPENFPQIIPTGVTMRVVGPTGGGRTGASPTRENPNHFDPWIVAPRIWVEFGPQATSSATATITPVAPVADIDFGAVRFGYAPAQVPAPQTFRVTNNSTSPTGPLTINLLSYGPGRGPGYAMDIRAFTLGATDSRVALTNQILHGNRAHLNATSGATIANLNPGEYVDLTVAPLHGLNVADWFNIDRYGRGGLAISQQGIGGFHGAVIAPHRAAVQVVGRDGILDSFDVSFLVEPLGRPTFSALNPALHDNIVNANTVQFHTGENWAGARTHDAVPLLIPNATGMPTNWVQITGTHLCSSRPTFTQTFGVGPVSQYTRTFQMSVPVRCATCVPGSPPCGQYVTFDPLPRGLGIFEDTHWFAGHLWGYPTYAGTFNVAFYLRHKSEQAYDMFGGDFKHFVIDVAGETPMYPPFVDIQADGFTLNWYRTRSFHNVLGGNNAGGNAALASSSYRLLVNGLPVYGLEDFEPGTQVPIAARTFDLRTLGLVGAPGEVFEISMMAIVNPDHATHWSDSPPNPFPVVLTAPDADNPYELLAMTSAHFEFEFTSSDEVTAWEIVDGLIPEGMTFLNGILSGTPATIGEYTLTVRATGVAVSTEFTLTLTVATVPEIPQNLVVTPGDETLTISWQAPETDGGTPVLYYQLFLNDVWWATIPSDRTFIFTGLTNGDEYTISLVAVNAAGPGPAASVTAIPDPGHTAPSAPQLLQATAGDGSIAVTWQAPLTDGGEPVTLYQISIDGITWHDLPSTVTYFTFDGLTNGVAHTISVRAVNDIGAGPVATVAATPVAPAPPPVNTAELSALVQYTATRQAARYTVATFNPFNEARAAAQAVLANAASTQAQVDAAYAALRSATTALVVRPPATGGNGGGAAPPPPAPPTPPPAPPVTEIEDDEVPLASAFAPFIEGFPDDTFRGANRISREEFVTILFRLHNPSGVPNGWTPTPQTFTDVAPGRWSFDAIEWAVAEGIVDAGADGLFLPRNELTRGELARMLVRAEGWTEIAEDIFSDIEGHLKTDYILKAVYEGIFEGFPDGTFRPDVTATRFEMVAALVRYVLGAPVTAEKTADIDFALVDVPRTHWAFRYVALATVGFEA